MARTVSAPAPWFGAARMVAENIGAALKGCKFVIVPFAGGMSELAHIPASTIVVGDLHRHIINMANVLKDRQMGPILIRRLSRQAFHPDTLAHAQAYCLEVEAGEGPFSLLDWAESFFVCCWMGRKSSWLSCSGY